MKECTIIAKVQLTDIVKLEPGEQLEDIFQLFKVFHTAVVKTVEFCSVNISLSQA